MSEFSNKKLREMLDDKSSGFTVPDGYFNQLSEQIFAQVDQTSHEKPSGHIINLGTRKIIGLAASLLILVIATFYIISSVSNPVGSEFGTDEIASYFQDRIETVDLEMIMENLPDDIQLDELYGEEDLETDFDEYLDEFEYDELTELL